MKHHAIRHRHVPPTPRRAAPELLLELRRRLTERDRALLNLVWEHRVLTTHQITAIFFSTSNKARRRLLELFRLRALERFQPWVPIGVAPFHWIIGPLGAECLAAHRETDLAGLGYRRPNALRICHSLQLGHQVGINEFFTRLHAHARRTGRAHLDEWWSERRCAALWGDMARPDAYGRWSETPPLGGPPATVDFFLEYDTGSVALDKVAAKLNGYEALAESTGITTPVLFLLPGPRRETNLRKVLGDTRVPVATAVQTSADPTEAVWLPAAQPGPRRRLIDLSNAWPLALSANPPENT